MTPPRTHRLPRALRTVAALLLLTTATPACTAAELVEATYPPTDENIANPERGLYLQFTAREEAGPLDTAKLRDLRDEKNITLILRMYYLKEFRDRPIADDRLQLIADDLQKIRDAGAKCILRFAYNESIGQPDAPIDVVLGHMEQLRPILRKNADIIAAAQAGFVGSWGEWHASTNNLREPANAKRIVGKWLDILPPTRFVQVRTPTIKAMLVGDMKPLTAKEAWTNTPRARIGHHNDCFLATFNDMGTYDNVAAEKKYLAVETRTLPMGGETCHVSEFVAVDNARAEFARFHWSYLNLGYQPDVIQGWRDAGFFGEVQRKLGYRLTLDRAAASSQAAAGGPLQLELDLHNAGWAAPFNPRAVELVLTPADGGATHTLKLAADPRAWLPGEPITLRETLTLPGGLPPGDYALHLALPDPEPALHDRADYAIRLANARLWNPDTGQHDLGLTVRITAAPDAAPDADADDHHDDDAPAMPTPP